jgi:hypothetical protein
MNLYKDCGDLPIRNFDIIYKTNDFNYLVVEFDGYNEVAIPKGANERWQEIKKEWVELIDDNTIAYYHQLISEVVYLQTRYDVSGMLLKEIFERTMHEETLEVYINALKEWKYIWNRKASKLVEIKRLLQQRKASENKLNLKLDELKDLQKENENDDDATTLEKQAVILEQITGKNNIDINTTSVRKWLEINKLATEINEQRRKANGR